MNQIISSKENQEEDTKALETSKKEFNKKLLEQIDENKELIDKLKENQDEITKLNKIVKEFKDNTSKKDINHANYINSNNNNISNNNNNNIKEKRHHEQKVGVQD